MTIVLTTAQAGDRFEARDGEVWTYVRKSSPLSHLLADDQGHKYAFGDFGSYCCASCQSGHDLIRALDSPAPAPAEPMGDAGLVEMPAAWINEGALEDLRKASARIDALLLRATKAEAALDEARKVIAPFVKEADLHPDSWSDAIEFGDHIELRDCRAARDWHSKHGGGDAKL